MFKAICKKSILIPLSMIIYLFMKPIPLSIAELGLYIEPYFCICISVIVTIAWLCCSPFRKSCCDGTWSELLFNAVPTELLLMIFFAQWHFIIALIIMLALIVFEIALLIALSKDENKYEFTNKSHQVYKVAFRRCSVLLITIICIIPCLLSVFAYKLQSPTYKAKQEDDNQLTSVSMTNSGHSGDPYKENEELWHCMKEEKWNNSSLEVKITVMQQLVDFESEILGIPTIPITADVIDRFTLGAYYSESNEIKINTEHLANSSIKDCIHTICHEVFHSHEEFLVNNIDWDSPIVNTYYFDEVRSWKDNDNDYKNAWADGYEEYKDQPLEKSANIYASIETLKIMNCINSLQNVDTE